MADTKNNTNKPEQTDGKPCVDCGAPLETVPRRGPWSRRCEKCRKEQARFLSREAHREVRKERAAAGLCIVCGEKQVKENPEKQKKYKMCEVCHAKVRARQIAAQGDKPPRPPKIPLTPEEKKEKWRIYNRERKKRLFAANPNLCSHCLKREREADHTYCTPCKERVSEYNNRRNRDRRAKHLCLICAQPTGGPQYCDGCRETTREYIRGRRKQSPEGSQIPEENIK